MGPSPQRVAVGASLDLLLMDVNDSRRALNASMLFWDNAHGGVGRVLLCQRVLCSAVGLEQLLQVALILHPKTFDCIGLSGGAAYGHGSVG